MTFSFQMSHRRTQPGQGRPKSRSGSAVVQFEEEDAINVNVCGVSECWNQSNDDVPPAPTPRGTSRRSQRLNNPSRSRPMGGIEKVIEYRPVTNGSVELRRITPSADGPVEHIDVVEPNVLMVSTVSYFFETKVGKNYIIA